MSSSCQSEKHLETLILRVIGLKPKISKKVTTAQLAGVSQDFSKKLSRAECLKMISKYCRKDSSCVTFLASELFQHLAVQDSELRFKCLVVLDYFFVRSALFRSEVVNSLQTIIELTIGKSRANCLPPPTLAADRLRKRALLILAQWCKDYGSKIKQLSLSRRFVESTLKLRVPDLSAASNQLSLQEKEREERLQAILETKFKRIHGEISRKKQSIDHTLKATVAQCSMPLLSSNRPIC